MNENITVIVAAAVVVLAGFGIVTMAEADVCDYTILDSPGNLAAGQTFHVTQVMAGITVDSEYRLTDVSGGEVDFVRTTVSSSGYVDLPADNLLPGVVLVDYSDPDNVPAGITVDRSADLYVINGSHTEGDTTTSGSTTTAPRSPPPRGSSRSAAAPWVPTTVTSSGPWRGTYR